METTSQAQHNVFVEADNAITRLFWEDHVEEAKVVSTPIKLRKQYTISSITVISMPSSNRANILKRYQIIYKNILSCEKFDICKLAQKAMEIVILKSSEKLRFQALKILQDTTIIFKLIHL